MEEVVDHYLIDVILLLKPVYLLYFKILLLNSKSLFSDKIAIWRDFMVRKVERRVEFNIHLDIFK